MGYGIAAVQNTLELWQLGYFKNIKKVVEMGSQELHLKAADFEEMVMMAGVTNYEKEKFPNLDNWPKQPRCSSRLLYKMLGVDEHYNVDLNGEFNSIPHDFNLPFEDTSMYSQFDLVTDHCACGHSINIAESYRTMHSLCKPGGLIIVAIPLWGGNGYFLYDKAFIYGIAAANNYKILFDSYVINTCTKTKNGSGHGFHIPINKELLNTIDMTKVSWLGVHAVLQKQEDSDFKIPYQNDYLSEQQGHLGFNRLFYKDPPGGYSYIPVFDLKSISGKVLFKELINKVINRFTKFKL